MRFEGVQAIILFCSLEDYPLRCLSPLVAASAGVAVVTSPLSSASAHGRRHGDGLLFGLSDRGNLYCINAQTGKTAWTDATARGKGGFGAIVDAGTGLIRILPKAGSSVPAEPRDTLGYYGVGAKWHLTQRFLVRADYRSYAISTKRDQNKDRNEWKAGFAFFF